MRRDAWPKQKKATRIEQIEKSHCINNKRASHSTKKLCISPRRCIYSVWCTALNSSILYCTPCVIEYDLQEPCHLLLVQIILTQSSSEWPFEYLIADQSDAGRRRIYYIHVKAHFLSYLPRFYWKCPMENWRNVYHRYFFFISLASLP